MAIREVRTNIDPEFVHDSLLKVYQKWIEFSLGIGKLGGRMLKYPSGKMASAIKATTDEDGYITGLYVDEESMGSLSSDLLMSGHKGFSIKKKMLQAGKKGVKRSKAGYLYRAVPISDKPRSPSVIFGEAKRITNLFTSKKGLEGGILQINRNLAKLWTTNYSQAHTGSSKIRTMSNKPGSARWWIPKMAPFNAGHILKSMLRNNALKSRIDI